MSILRESLVWFLVASSTIAQAVEFVPAVRSLALPKVTQVVCEAESGRLFAISPNESRIFEVDPKSGEELLQIEFESPPVEALFKGKTLLVRCQSLKGLAQFDIALNRKLKTIQLPSVPQSLAGSKLDNSFCYASCPGDPCLLYTSPSPRDQRGARMPSSA